MRKSKGAIKREQKRETALQRGMYSFGDRDRQQRMLVSHFEGLAIIAEKSGVEGSMAAVQRRCMDALSALDRRQGKYDGTG